MCVRYVQVCMWVNEQKPTFTTFIQHTLLLFNLHLIYVPIAYAVVAYLSVAYSHCIPHICANCVHTILRWRTRT